MIPPPRRVQLFAIRHDRGDGFQFPDTEFCPKLPRQSLPGFCFFVSGGSGISTELVIRLCSLRFQFFEQLSQPICDAPNLA